MAENGTSLFQKAFTIATEKPVDKLPPALRANTDKRHSLGSINLASFDGWF